MALNWATSIMSVANTRSYACNGFDFSKKDSEAVRIRHRQYSGARLSNVISWRECAINPVAKSL